MMSDKWRRLRGRAVHGTAAQDKGMTLPEVLIAIAITGLVASTLAMATTVILRQTDNTEGRANNARSEQNINLWMPTDLASAETVDKQPKSLPCGPNAPDGPAFPACPPGAELRGSNALLLTWTGRVYDDATNSIVDTLTVVSYRVVKEADGEFRLYRVQCYSVAGAMATCQSLVVLRDLDPPPDTVEWIEGVTPATWVMTVTDALLADDISGAGDVVELPDPGYNNKGAQRLVVTINGGGDAAGAGGGKNQISLSAGGTDREFGLTTDDLTGTPNFNAARSRCGGNFGMVVDHSGSISQTELNAIKGGIRQFIDTFAGTPIKLQIVIFDNTALTLGAGASWGKYFNMLDEADVTTLRDLVGDPAVTSSGIQRGSGTNWEDGLFRMLRNSDGTIQSQLPGTIIFFTDGMPTRSRLDYTSASAPRVEDPADEGLTGGTGDFEQVAWNRAERIVRDRGAINLIGVYVDLAMNLNSNPKVIPRSEWMIRGEGNTYEMGDNVGYEQGTVDYQRNKNVVFRVGSSGMRYEKLVSGNWVSAANGYSSSSSTARNAYLAANSNPTESDGWRARKTSTASSWVTITEAQYHASIISTGTDNWSTTVGSLSSTWYTVTKAQYDLSNTNTNESDGWRATTTWAATTAAAYQAGNVDSGSGDLFRSVVSGSPSTWTPVSAAKYTASNTTSDSSDGWRATFHEADVLDINNYATIGNLIAGNTSGIEGGFVEAMPRGGPYLDAAAADLFVLPNYTNFANALASVALDQCGGTVTLQTKVGTSSALDPFTYQNTTSNETVQTSAAYRSGTFDVALPGGTSQVVTITPQEFTSLNGYAPNGWTCKASGVAYPFTTAPVVGHEPWSSITLTVTPNKAVSCVQQVVKT